MTLRRFIPTFFALLALFGVARAATAADFTADQKKQIGETVREYLLENPEVIVEVMHELEKRRDAERRQRQQSALKDLDASFASPLSPVGGNAKGDVTIVEFFDYRCSYCKRVFPHLREVLAADGGVRLLMKEFPVLGPESVLAAHAALAVWKLAPDRYMDFHTRLMELKGSLSENKVVVTASEVGVKEADLREAMAGDDVRKELAATQKLAQDLGLTGTPAFVIGGQVFPGYLELDQIKQIVAHARAAGK